MADHRDPNILEPVWDVDLAEPPLVGRLARVAAAAGARELGGTLYELPPGGALTPYHAHLANEELLVVLSGAPTLRTPDGMRTLRPGAVVAFPRGPEGAHRLTNRGAAPARFLMVSTMNLPDVAEYPDTGGTLVITGAAAGRAYPGGADVPYPGLVREAMDEAAVRERDAG